MTDQGKKEIATPEEPIEDQEQGKEEEGVDFFDDDATPPEDKKEEQGEEKQFYTPDELEDLAKRIAEGEDVHVDTSRLSPEGKAIWQELQRGITPKLQERAMLEKALDKALSNPSIAKELINDDELVNTISQHPELRQKLEQAREFAQGKRDFNLEDQAYEVAKEEYRKRYGKDFDEEFASFRDQRRFQRLWDEAYNQLEQQTRVEIQRKAFEQGFIKFSQAAAEKYKEPFDEIWQKVNQFAEESLTVREYKELDQKFTQAIVSGDIVKALSIIDQVRAKMENATDKNSEKPKVTTPPPQEGGSAEIDIESENEPLTKEKAFAEFFV